MLAPSTHTMSVDCRLRNGCWFDERKVLAYGRYLGIAQLLLMYWTTGSKVSAYWVPGGDFSALYFILQQPSWHRGDMSWLAPYFALTQIGTCVSWFWEVSAPLWLLALWYSSTQERGGFLRMWFCRLRVKWIYLGIGLVFHGGVLLFMAIGPFSVISLAYYVCLVRPTEWQALVRRFRSDYVAEAQSAA